jgi:NAD(P)-dependent dehydrogenase (short-subunit alcohol dehydrogenase family)
MDVSREAEVERVFGEIRKKFGRIDVLVNNAGISGVNKPTHAITEAEWDRLMAVNVKGVFFCTKHVISHMRDAGGGSIINLSSVYGIVGGGDVPPYHASKGAVRLMSKNDALIYAREKIRVNSVHPGFIWTPMVEHLVAGVGSVGEVRKLIDARNPLGHAGEPEDIAWGIVYLASEESKFITGSELVIDGGYTAQ